MRAQLAILGLAAVLIAPCIWRELKALWRTRS